MTNELPTKINTLLKTKSKKALEENTSKVLLNSKVKKLINKLDLNQLQIKEGMNIIQKYYNYVTTHNSEPEWQVYVNNNGFLDIDITKQKWYQLQKTRNNFWLTNITPLDKNIEYFLQGNNPKSSTKINEELVKTFKKYGQIASLIKMHLKMQANQGLFIVDEDIIQTSSALKYIAYRFASKNKTVAYLDINNLYTFASQDFKSREQIIPLLNEVDYLFLVGLGMGSKPLWFIQDYIINILVNRQRVEKITYILSVDDISQKNHVPLISFKNKFDQESFEKVENVLSSLIKKTFKILKQND